jgi:hypothetical protein
VSTEPRALGRGRSVVSVRGRHSMLGDRYPRPQSATVAAGLGAGPSFVRGVVGAGGGVAGSARARTVARSRSFARPERERRRRSAASASAPPTSATAERTGTSGFPDPMAGAAGETADLSVTRSGSGSHQHLSPPRPSTPCSTNARGVGGSGRARGARVTPTSRRLVSRASARCVRGASRAEARSSRPLLARAGDRVTAAAALSSAGVSVGASFVPRSGASGFSGAGAASSGSSGATGVALSVPSRDIGSR